MSLVEGRSYHVVAPTEDMARPVARSKAKREGHPSPEAQILWLERIGPTVTVVGGNPLWLWEVVIAVTPTQP